MKSGDRLDAVAVYVDDEGRGVTSTQLRVADLLPGERAQVEIEHVSEHGHGAWGRIVSRQGPPSPSRAEPVCPAFGRCGGCRWQHLAYAQQLVEKRRIVTDALASRGLDLVALPVVPAPSETGYRNKGKYVFGKDDDGSLVLGSYAPRTHRVVSTLGCAIVSPVIDEVARAGHREAAALSLEPYDESGGGGHLRYLLIRHGADDRVVATIVTRSNASADAMATFAERLLDVSPATGVLWARNDRDDGGLLDGAPVLLSGDPLVGEPLGGVLCGVDPNAFWQINRKQAGAIYELVGELVGSAEHVLDAYAGVGAIGIAAARAGAKVTTVELDASSVAVTRAAVAEAGLPLVAVSGDAAEAFDHDYEAVVVNPPRRGLSAAVRARLIASSPPLIIYLSCGPASLARDLSELVAAGYRVDRVQPFDMMPGTPQVETLVTVRRQTALA